MASSASPHELVACLRREVARLEAGRPPENERPISTGSEALDRLLPAGGLRRGTLVEYLSPAAGSGAGMLALAAAREACRDGRALVVLDRPIPTPSVSKGIRFGRFYPPAAAAWGIDLSAMLVLRPDNDADGLWVLDQALRCPGVGAVWATCDRFDVRDFRRLQLAAECGGTLGLLMRPARLRGQPTWADVQWQVRRTKSKRHFPRASYFVLRTCVELVRCRGAPGGKVVLLELDETAGIWREVPGHATHPVPVLARLADPTAARRA